jgi:hypothetical protein
MLRKITLITVFSVLMLSSNFVNAECGWLYKFFGYCTKSPTDYECFGTITIAVKIAGPDGTVGLEYREVSVSLGNRIDCKVGRDVCSEESKC